MNFLTAGFDPPLYPAGSELPTSCVRVATCSWSSVASYVVY